MVRASCFSAAAVGAAAGRSGRRATGKIWLRVPTHQRDAPGGTNGECFQPGFHRSALSPERHSYSRRSRTWRACAPAELRPVADGCQQRTGPASGSGAGFEGGGAGHHVHGYRGEFFRSVRGGKRLSDSGAQQTAYSGRDAALERVQRRPTDSLLPGELRSKISPRAPGLFFDLLEASREIETISLKRSRRPGEADTLVGGQTVSYPRSRVSILVTEVLLKHSQSWCHAPQLPQLQPSHTTRHAPPYHLHHGHWIRLCLLHGRTNGRENEPGARPTTPTTRLQGRPCHALGE